MNGRIFGIIDSNFNSKVRVYQVYTPVHSKRVNSLSVSSTLRRNKLNDCIDGVSQDTSSMQQLNLYSFTDENSIAQVYINLEISLGILWYYFCIPEYCCFHILSAGRMIIICQLRHRAIFEWKKKSLRIMIKLYIYVLFLRIVLRL